MLSLLADAVQNLCTPAPMIRFPHIPGWRLPAPKPLSLMLPLQALHALPRRDRSFLLRSFSPLHATAPTQSIWRQQKGDVGAAGLNRHRVGTAGRGLNQSAPYFAALLRAEQSSRGLCCGVSRGERARSGVLVWRNGKA